MTKYRRAIIKFHDTPLGRYLFRVLIWVSVGINVVLFFGESNQSFSARNYQWQRDGRKNICWLINFCTGDPDHCLKYWAYWQLRRRKLGEDIIIQEEKIEQGKNMFVPAEVLDQLRIYDEFIESERH